MVTHRGRRAHVVGRGIVGLATAFELLQRGWRVTLVGPSAREGTASRAAIGVSALKGQTGGDTPIFAIKIRGHGMLPSWLERLETASGQAIPRNFTGVFEPFSMAGYDVIMRRVFHRGLPGPDLVQVLGPGIYPMPADGAFHYLQDGWFDPEAALLALERYLLAHGAEVVDAPVRRLQDLPEEDDIVLAAGIFSNEILEHSGIFHLSQKPVPGTTLRGLGAASERSIAAKLGKRTLLLKGDTLGSWVYGSDREAGTLAAEVRAYLASSAFSASPKSASGIRGRFRDRAPAAGCLPVPSRSRPIWVALGFYKNGLQLAHLFAHEIAKAMTDGSPLDLPQAVLVDRFRG